MTRKYLLNISLVMITVLLSLLISCTHSVMLTIPEYSEEALTWCGPATGQMLMNGYPSGSCYISQEDIWASIGTHKTKLAWDTDPVGLQGAMIDLCHPSGTWSIHSEADSTILMYQIAWLMTKYNYGVATTLNTLPHNSIASHAEHWIAIRGIVSDKNPLSNPSINLLWIWINDPSPASLGDPPIVRYISASTWYSEFQRVTKPASTYNDHFIAIIEPPKETGRAIAPKEITEGTIISPEAAITFAKKWVKVHKLGRMKPYKILTETEPVEAFLVNKNYRAYYIVPFVKDTKAKFANAAMLINAYTGAMKEVGTFNAVRYLAKEQATRTALDALKIKDPRKFEIELVSPPGYDFSKYFPLYKVQANDKLIYVDRKGDTYNENLFKRKNIGDIKNQ